MNITKEKKDKSSNNLVEKIREGDEQAFEKLFFNNFHDLCSFAYQFTSCKERAKDIVQDVFVKLWNRRKEWYIHRSVKAYLLKAVRNSALNYIDHVNHRSDVRDAFSKEQLRSVKKTMVIEQDNEARLLDQIWQAVTEMPDRRRKVFVLYHRQGLSYNEISEVMDISRKTVENHMGLALKDIRAQIERSSI